MLARQRDPHLSRRCRAPCRTARGCRASSVYGGRFMPPSTTTRHPGVSAVVSSSMRSMCTPSPTEFTRRSISHPASGEITFGRDPPHTGAAFSVMPRSRSTMPWIRTICRASSTTADAPSSNDAAGMRAATLHAHDEPAHALARGDAGAAVAGGFGDQHIGRLAGLALDPFARGGAADLLVRRQQQHDRAARRHAAVAGSSAPRGTRGSFPPSCRRCPARAPSRRSPGTACRPACRATRRCRDGPPRSTGLPSPGVRAIRLSPKPSRPGYAGERGAGARQFALGHVHQAVDRGGVRGGGFHRHPGGEFGQKVLGASHVGLRHWLVLALGRLTGGGCVHRTRGVVHGAGRGRESAALGYCL